MSSLKAQQVKIPGVDRDDLIALIEPDGNWYVITTKEDVENFTASFAKKDEYGTINRHGEIIAAEEDVVFVGGPFEIEFNFENVLSGIVHPSWNEGKKKNEPPRYW